MGKYLDVFPDGTYLPEKGKADAILRRMPGAREIKAPKTPKEWQPDLVCVVENGWMDAAGYAYDARELDRFMYPDGRPRRWLIVPELHKYIVKSIMP
jgi:hypothetical protein